MENLPHRQRTQIIDLDSLESSACESPADLPASAFGAAVALIDGRPSVCGGYDLDFGTDCYSYNFNAKTWSKTASLDGMRGSASSVVMDNAWWIAGEITNI